MSKGGGQNLGGKFPSFIWELTSRGGSDMEVKFPFSAEKSICVDESILSHAKYPDLLHQNTKIFFTVFSRPGPGME